MGFLKVIVKYKEGLRIEASSSQFLNPKTLGALIHKDNSYVETVKYILEKFFRSLFESTSTDFRKFLIPC